MIGTSVSLQNSEKVLYPSLTVCLNHEVAIFNGEALYDSSESDKELFNLTHTPDMSDVLISIRQYYGPITNMSYIYLFPNMSSFIVSQIAEDQRVYRQSNKIFAHTHHALDASPLEESFDVRISHRIS